MFLVSNRLKSKTFLVKALSDKRAVDGTKAPVKGWLPVEVTQENVRLLTPKCRKVYDGLPRAYFIKLGTPVTYHGMAQKKVTIPGGTTMAVIAKNGDYVSALYQGRVVTVGRNRSHEFFERVSL